MRPASMMSPGSMITVPPAARTFAAVSSASCTHTYVFHAAAPGSPCIGEPTAPTSPPRIRPM
jgi:hypothetical protein